MSAAAKIAAKRVARAAAGRCTECETPRLKGHSLCRRHFEMRQARMKAWNEKRIRNARCYCGAWAQPGRDRCLACLRIERQRARERMQALKTAGKCVTCGSRRALPRKVRCLRCVGRAHGYYVNRRDRRRLMLARRGDLAARVFTLHPYSIAQV